MRPPVLETFPDFVCEVRSPFCVRRRCWCGLGAFVSVLRRVKNMLNSGLQFLFFRRIHFVADVRYIHTLHLYLACHFSYEADPGFSG